jgi:hypothetical protein
VVSTDDHRVEPTRHADELAAQSPGLAALLRASTVQFIAARFEEADAASVAAQRDFRRLASRARWAVLLTATVASLLMLAGASQGLSVPAPGQIFVALSILGLVVGGLATMWLFRIRQGELLEQWMKTRALAESRRLEYFLAVTQPVAGDPALNLLQLEYFCRHQLDVQIAYYRDRGARHRDSARRILALGGWAVFISTVTVGAAGVLGAVSAPLASIAAVAIVGSALSAFASSLEAVNQDTRNAERYARTRETLEQLASRRDDVRRAVGAGTAEALPQFVAAIHEQLSLEHRQWLEGADARTQGLAVLEETLARTRDRADAQRA